MIVVSDTTAITSLLAIHREGLLQALFGLVIIPTAVLVELEAAHDILPDFIESRPVQNLAAVTALLAAKLDLGEAEAIVLSEEIGADYLLIDEMAGRGIAQERGLNIIGVLGVLARAKNRGLIAAIRPELDALRDRSGLWISTALREQILIDVGEA